MITLERFKDLVAAYGADPARWPERERLAALDLLQRSADARSVMEEARAIDRLLDLSPTTSVSSDLQTRILAALPQGGSSGSGITAFLASLLPGRPAWVPAAAFALSLALGIGAGAYAPTLAGLEIGGRDAALIAMSGGFDDDDFWAQPGEGT